MRSMDGNRQGNGIVMRLFVVLMASEEGDQADLLQHVQVDGTGVRDEKDGQRQDGDLIHRCCGSNAFSLLLQLMSAERKVIKLLVCF